MCLCVMGGGGGCVCRAGAGGDNGGMLACLCDLRGFPGLFVSVCL